MAPFLSPAANGRGMFRAILDIAVRKNEGRRRITDRSEQDSDPVRILEEAYFPELPNYYRGKVRENYDLPDDRRIIISTDRLSAFDRILT